MKKVEDIRIERGMTITDLVDQFSRAGGFTAAKLAEALDIMEEMTVDEDCLRFISFPACIFATGTRGVLVEMAKRKMFDAVITTCGAVDHDLARVWKDYYKGSFMMDDLELREEGINRLGNVLVPNESYGTVLEERLQPMIAGLYEKGMTRPSTAELMTEVGKQVEDEASFLHWCARNEIPVVIPGITDGAFGSNLWMFYQTHRDFVVDLMKDEQLLSDMVFDAGKSGALMIGGGISKHHTIWWNQFRDGLDYSVYITTAVEHDGSLSGARLREAISWGKLNMKAKYVTVEGDATVLLPLMAAALIDRIDGS